MHEKNIIHFQNNLSLMMKIYIFTVGIAAVG